MERGSGGGAPALDSDATIVASGDALPQAQQSDTFRHALEGAHGSAHGYIGGDIGGQHQAFEDPFVYLLAQQRGPVVRHVAGRTRTGMAARPDQVYGDQSNTNDDRGILHHLQPWDGTVQFGSPIEPWVGTSPQIEVKDCRHPSVVLPPCYDTLPLSVEQVAPAPGDPLRFLDVVENLPTSRALRLRVRGCTTVTATATVSAPFTVPSASVTSPEPVGYEQHDLLVWVLFAPGAAGTGASGTLTITVTETGDVFTVPSPRPSSRTPPWERLWCSTGPAA